MAVAPPPAPAPGSAYSGSPTREPCFSSTAHRAKSASLRNLKRLTFVASFSPYMNVRVSWKARTTLRSPTISSSGLAVDATKTILSTSSIESSSVR